MRARRENPRANPNRPDGADLPNARRGARARSGCGSVASLLPRRSDSRIRTRKSGWGQGEDRSRLLRLQAGESSVRERSVVLGRSARRVTARRAALGFFVLPQLHATAFVEVQLTATVRSPACDDQGSHCSLPAQLSGEFRQAVSRTRFVRSGNDAFRTAAHCGITNDAEGEGQSGATKDADRPRRVARQSSSQPNYAALPGNGKAVALPATRQRTALTTDRCADLPASSWSRRKFVIRSTPAPGDRLTDAGPERAEGRIFLGGVVQSRSCAL